MEIYNIKYTHVTKKRNVTRQRNLHNQIHSQVTIDKTNIEYIHIIRMRVLQNQIHSCNKTDGFTVTKYIQVIR